MVTGPRMAAQQGPQAIGRQREGQTRADIRDPDKYAPLSGQAGYNPLQQRELIGSVQVMQDIEQDDHVAGGESRLTKIRRFDPAALPERTRSPSRFPFPLLDTMELQTQGRRRPAVRPDAATMLFGCR